MNFIGGARAGLVVPALACQFDDFAANFLAEPIKENAFGANLPSVLKDC